VPLVSCQLSRKAELSDMRLRQCVRREGLDGLGKGAEKPAPNSRRASPVTCRVMPLAQADRAQFSITELTLTS